MKRILSILLGAVVLAAPPVASRVVALETIPGCADIVSGFPNYFTLDGVATVDVALDTAAPDCTYVRYGLSVFPAVKLGPTSSEPLTLLWMRGDGAATLEGRGQLRFRLAVPGSPRWICVQAISYLPKAAGHERRDFDYAPDSCELLKLDGGSSGGGRGWN